MKKLTFLLFAVVVFASSCTREYICQCKTKYTGNKPGLPGERIDESVFKNTLKSAQEECRTLSNTTTQDDITTTTTCDLY